MVISTFYEHIIEGAGQRGISLEDAAAFCLEAGLSGLEVICRGNPKPETLEVVGRLKACGMHVNSMPYFCDPMHDSSLASMDGILNAARLLETSRIMVVPGYYSPEEARDTARRRSLEPLSYLLDRCARDGITVGMENFGHPLSPCARTADLLWYMQNLPGLTCTMDTGNFLCFGEELLYAYDRLNPYITSHLHCKDRAWRGRAGEKPSINVNGLAMYPCAVGTGFLPVETILYRLAARGFDGAVSIEHFGSADQLGDLELSSRHIRRCFAR